MSADFNAGSIEGTLELDTAPYLAGLKLARDEARNFERQNVKPKVSLDDKEFTVKKDVAEAELDKFDHKKVTAKADVDTGAAMAKLAVLNRVLDAGGLGGKTAGAGFTGAKFAGMAGGLMSIASAALPVVGSLGGVAAAAIGVGAAMGGMAAAGGAAMATLGISVGLFAKVATSDMADIQTAIKNGTDLTGPAGYAEAGFKRITSAWDKFKKDTAGGVDSVLGRAFNIGASVLPKLEPIVNIMSGGLQGVLDQINSLVKSPFFNTFLSGFEGVEQELVHGLGPVVHNVLDGLMHGFLAFRPLITVVANGVQTLSGSFDKFMSGGGVANFVKFAAAQLPNVLKLLSGVFTLVGRVVGGLAPVAGAGLKFVTQLIHTITPTASAMKDFSNFIVTSMPMVAKLIGDAFKAIGPLISGLEPLIKPALGFIDSLVQVLGQLDLKPFTTAFGEVLDVIKPLLPVAMSLINAVLKPISTLIGDLARGPLKDFVSSLGTGLAPAFKDISTILTELAGPLTKFIGSIANLANPTGVKLITTLLGIFTKIVGDLAGPLSSVAVLLESVVDTALEAMVPILKAVSPLFTMLAKLIGTELTQAAKVLAPVFGEIVNSLFPVFQQLLVALMPVVEEIASALFPALVQIIEALVPVIKPLLAIITELITKVILPILIPALKMWADYMSHYLIPILTLVITWVAKALAWFLKFAEGPQQAQAAVKKAWDWIKQETVDFGEWILKKLGDLEDLFKSTGNYVDTVFVDLFKSAWSTIKSDASDAWHHLKGGFDQIEDWGKDLGHWLKNTFVGFFHDSFNAIETAISKTWGGIENAALIPVRFVVNTVLDNGLIPAINKVGSVFPGFNKIGTISLGDLAASPTGSGGGAGGSGHSTGSSAVRAFKTGGRVPGNSPSDTADDQIIRATSDEYMVQRRSARSVERAFPGLLDYINAHGTLPGYKGGGWVDKLLTAANPVNVLSNSVTPLINKIPGAGSVLHDVLHGTSSLLLKDAESWMKDKLVDGPTSVISGAVKNIKNAVGGSGVARWAPEILKALSMLGQPASLLSAVEYRMNRESGGNPNAINNWDSNAARGDPSRGLMQTIGSTFAAYAGPYRNMSIYNPMANIYAALNYALHAYGSISRAMFQPGGYAAGILKSVPGFRWIGENGPELQKLPGGLSITNAQRSMQIARTGSNNPPAADSNSDVLDRLERMIKALDKLPSKDDQNGMLASLRQAFADGVKAAQTQARAHA